MWCRDCEENSIVISRSFFVSLLFVYAFFQQLERRSCAFWRLCYNGDARPPAVTMPQTGPITIHCAAAS